MKDIVDSVKEKLRDKDLRITPQRKAILGILVENKDKHLSVEDIYTITRKEYPELGLATIYRTIDLFEELGVVDRLDFGDKGARYEFNNDQDGHYHHHLICVKCGRITEFNDDLLDNLERKVASESGFTILNHSLRFYGICSQCQDS